ncbi:uncharacterized protein LOC115584705 [Sparus aurata]|uniref:uncharacterized protein LOC115584705 n=1 Tax=Sparus aurata TaxID=8175 RepID=UPI0011C10184|nr:uncharacterized protein LOC115584705 [Sparus aurata]
MKIHQMLTCIFILSLQDRNTGLINAQTIAGKEGGNITYVCHFLFSGSRKIFCKERCEENDILVETTGDRARRGRYSIKYVEAADILSTSALYVSITNLTKSDSGRYTCRLGRKLLQDSNTDFEIRVADAPFRLKPTRILPPPPTSVTSASIPTPSAAATGVQLYVRLTLVVIFIVSSAAVLIFCRRRASKAEDPPVEVELVNVTEANPVHEELREDRRSRSPPVGISTVYSLPWSQFAEQCVKTVVVGPGATSPSGSS